MAQCAESWLRLQGMWAWSPWWLPTFGICMVAPNPWNTAPRDLIPSASTGSCAPMVYIANAAHTHAHKKKITDES